MGRTILLERRQSESVGRRNSRTTFLRSDWPRPFARREVGVGASVRSRPSFVFGSAHVASGWLCLLLLPRPSPFWGLLLMSASVPLRHPF
ncbi:hypothetical protein TNCV_4188091 [Trichonephila clavipes]|nr:hypothetical protein TNCV_4188091 [Trichonephila clavipes]